jgi:hypothetical protein
LVENKNKLISKKDEYENKKVVLENLNEDLAKRLEELNGLISQNETAVEYQKKLIANKENIQKIENEITDIVYSRKGSKKESLPKVNN